MTNWSPRPIRRDIAAELRLRQYRGPARVGEDRKPQSLGPSPAWVAGHHSPPELPHVVGVLGRGRQSGGSLAVVHRLRGVLTIFLMFVCSLYSDHQENDLADGGQIELATPPDLIERRENVNVAPGGASAGAGPRPQQQRHQLQQRLKFVTTRNLSESFHRAGPDYACSAWAELVQTTSRESDHPPADTLPNGRTLRPNQVLVTQPSTCWGTAGGAPWTCGACDETVYGPPLNTHCTCLDGPPRARIFSNVT